MPVTFQLRPDGILEIVRSSAVGGTEEDATLVTRHGDTGINPAMCVLVDSRKVVPVDSCEVVQRLASAAQATPGLGCGALALVVDSDVGYGMARMYMALTEARHPNTQVFRDYDEAVSWLQSQSEALGGPPSSSDAPGPGA